MINKAVFILLAAFSFSNYASATSGQGFNGLPSFDFHSSNWDDKSNAYDKNFDIAKAIADCSVTIANQKGVLAKLGYVIVEEYNCKQVPPSHPANENIDVRGRIVFLK